MSGESIYPLFLAVDALEQAAEAASSVMNLCELGAK